MPPEPTMYEMMWNPTVYPFWIGMSLFLGLLWGSFFNVAIYRLPMGMSVNRPRRSFCFGCGTQLGVLENIPVLSLLFQKARCRHCNARVSPRYAVVELLTAALFVIIFMAANPPEATHFAVATIWYWAFAGLLIIGTFTDFDHWIIPDEVTIGGTVAALIFALIIGIVDRQSILTAAGPFPALRAVAGGSWVDYVEVLIIGSTQFIPKLTPMWWEGPANAVLGAMFGPALLYGIGEFGRILFRKDAMGFGDVKLFALIGATLGPVNCLVVLMISAMFGSVAGIIPMILAKFRSRTETVLMRGRDLPAAPSDPDMDVVDPQEKFLELMKDFVPPNAPHHLPYGPWIALAALIVLIFSTQVRTGLQAMLSPV